MSNAAKARAEEVGDSPEVQRWVKRLRRLAADMPLGVWVFVAAGTPSVMVLNEEGQPYETGPHGASVDPDAVIATVSGGHWDGGDF